MTEEEDDTEADANFLREAARVEIDVLHETRRLILEQHSHSFKWLTASLLAINGGAAIAILNSEAIDAIWKVRSGAFFALGILSALLVAVVAQRINIRSLTPIQRQIGYWMTVVQDGSRLEEFEQTLGNEVKSGMRFSWVIPGFGWLSGLLFAAGLALSAHGVLQKEEGVTIVKDIGIGGESRRQSR